LSSLGCLFAAAGLGISTNTLDVSGATVKGISLLMLMVPLQSVLAVRLFQLGVRYSGSTAASLLSTMEPVTSTILGMLILNEAMDAKKLIGCAAIVLSVILVVFGTSAGKQARKRRNKCFSASHLAYEQVREVFSSIVKID
jgi:drug/metabolite transporter (DMT)-like permease